MTPHERGHDDRRYDDAALPLARTPKVDDDVRDELDFHIEQRTAELVATGMTPADARAHAQTLFGDRASIEAACRAIERRRRYSAWKQFRWQSLWQDVAGGLRLLRKSPMFTAAAVLTLAIGIGANAAVFSLLNRAILQPLAYPNANRLVSLSEQTERGYANLPWATAIELRARTRSVDAMASYGSSTATVLGTAAPLRIRTAAVSAEFFSVFGVRALHGRLPLAEEHREGATPVVIVSHAFWRDQLGSPASLAGVQLRLDRVHDVIGVLPPDFDFPAAAQLWIPIELERQATSHTAHNWDVVARLRANVSPAAAQRELTSHIEQLRTIHAPDFDGVAARVTLLQDVLTAGLKTPLYLLFAASAALLLAACTNLASAQLARGAARVGELAVRSALGAGRLRLVRQLLTESAVLALLGAALGLVVARVLLRAFANAAPAELRLGEVPIDGWVLLFALTVAMVTALGFGLYPALKLSDADTNLVLREGGRGTDGRRAMRVWHVLVALEIAMAVMLLAGSQALVRSFAQVMRSDLGFTPEGITTMAVNLPSVTYADSGNAVPLFHEAALVRLRATAGVQSVGFANRLPLEGGPGGSLEVEGKPLNPRGPYNATAAYRVVGGDYFAAMGIRVLEGRAFATGDDARAPRVVMVDETFAREQWPEGNVIGRRLRPYGMDGGEEPWFTVIGVVASVRVNSITAPPQPTYYFEHRQRPSFRTNSVSYVARASTSTGDAMDGALLRELRAVDAQVPIESGTMARVLANAVATRRFMMLLLTAFAGMALVLAAVGIYAVVSFTVARRTREIGIRLALGASPSRVLQLIVRSAMNGVVPGLVAGALLSLASTRTLRSLLYGVSPSDPVGLAIAVAVLGVLGLASAILPVRRATRIDPLMAMRSE